MLASGQQAEEICILSRNREIGRAISRALTASDIPVAKERVKVDVNDNYKLLKAILNILSENNITASVKEVQRISGVSDVTERHIQKVILGQCIESECEEALKPTRDLSKEIRLSPVADMADAIYRYSIKAAEIFENIVNDRHTDGVFEAFEDFCRNNDASWPISQQQLKELFATFEDETRKENRRGGALSNGVKVSTIHAAKGLEYNVVIITGLSEGKYPSTDQIDKVASARNAQLLTLSASRENYYSLKALPIREMYDNSMRECHNPSFFKNEANSMEEFQNEVESIRNDIISITADGVEGFIDAYRYYILPLEVQYQNEVNEQSNLLLMNRTKEENLNDEVLLLEQEDEKAAAIKRQELDEISSKSLSIERKRNKLRDREIRFSKSIATIRQLYGLCLNASGLLADMEKADEMENLRIQLEEEREKRINEERRLYYVAVTRARDFLYLCYEAGTAPSEFIKIIDDELKESHIMLTLEEEREINRLTQALHEEVSKRIVDDDKINTQQDNILNQKKFESYIQKRTSEFNSEHPVLADLHTTAQLYYKKAIGLLFVSELTGSEFKTEFAHNMQRTAESILLEYSGSEALPYKTKDYATADQIVHDIRKIGGQCITSRPSPKYLTRLLTEEGPYSDEMKTLKSAGIMHYIIRSGKYEIPSSIKSTWKRTERLIRSDPFLVATLDLSSIRNTLIHRDQEQWPEDPVPSIIRNVEMIAENCKKHTDDTRGQKTVQPVSLKAHNMGVLKSSDLRVGRKVKHRQYGMGKVVELRDSTFSVDFGPKGRKAFLLSSASLYFTDA